MYPSLRVILPLASLEVNMNNITQFHNRAFILIVGSLVSKTFLQGIIPFYSVGDIFFLFTDIVFLSEKIAVSDQMPNTT